MRAAFCICVLVLGVLVAPLNSFAETQVLPTDKGTVKVGLSTVPETPAPGAIKLKIDFLNPKTGTTQDHIDYIITVTKDGKSVFGPIPLTHTSIGTVTIPVELKEKGEYKVTVDVQGVLFVPTSEKATFSVMVGKSGTPATPPAKSDSAKQSDAKASDKNAKSGTAGKVPVKIDTKKTDAKTTKPDSKSTKKAPPKKP